MADNIKKQDDEAFKFKLNGAEFYCNFLISRLESFDKALDEKEGIMLTQPSIVSLDIHETLFQPFVSGKITINNPFDYFDQNHDATGIGKDFLHIRFYDYQDTDNEKLKEIKIDYSFVLTSENNSISKADRANNFKTFSLVDANFFLLNKKVPYNKTFPKRAGSALIGDIIKDDILTEIFGDEIIDTENWDSGNHIINKTLGTDLTSMLDKVRPGIHWRYSDVLKFLLRYNYSLTDNNLPVQTFLQYDRTNKKYSLRPLNNFFNTNQSNTLEAFGIGDLTSASSQLEKDDSNANTNKNNPTSDENIKFNVYQGNLRNADLTTPYTFYTNEFFTNYLVTSYNPYYGGNSFTKIDIQKIKDVWQLDFIDSFKLVGGVPEAFLNFDTDEERPIKPYSLPEFDTGDCINIAKAQMVSNLTFFNLQLNLDNLGDTRRRPGKFVDVVKFVEREDRLDSKLLGRWFITNVHHRFFRTTYQTVLQCVKPYVGKITK